MDRIEKAIAGIGILSIGYLLTHSDKLKPINDVLNLVTPILSRSNNDSKIVIASEKIVSNNESFNTFISLKYGVQFDYPKSWKRNPRYEDKYEGPDGFFEIANFTGVSDSIESAVEEQINAPYKPYGEKPIIENLTLDGQPACVIFPSDDQNEFYKDRDCAIVIKYPAPNDVNGHLYNFVDIWTTPDFVPTILHTFKFIKPQ